MGRRAGSLVVDPSWVEGLGPRSGRASGGLSHPHRLHLGRRVPVRTVRLGGPSLRGRTPSAPGSAGFRVHRRGSLFRAWGHEQCQGGPISTEPRINDRIRVNEVRLVGPNGEQVGIVAIGDALRLAQESDLDLVEVAPMARPPVCKLMDYGKFKYESAMKAREARKNQAHTIIKEMKLRPKIDPHDYDDQEGSRRPVPQAGRQGQDHDHVPRPRAVPARAGLPAAAAARQRRRGARFRRVGAEAGRPKHDHGPRTAQEEGRGPRRASSGPHARRGQR